VTTQTQSKDTFERSFPIPASPARVFAALTDPAELSRWFAEHVHIEPREGGAFQFWGRFTAWIPTRDAADQRITRFKPPEALSIAWTWRDTRCTADLTLRLAASACTLNIRMHAAEPRMGFGDLCIHYMGDFWRYNVGNLRTYLKTGSPVIRPDFAGGPGGVDMSVTINAPPSKVFRALTDPALMDRWIATKAAVDLRVGGEYSLGWMLDNKGTPQHCGPKTLIEVIPDRLIVHDWFHNDEPPTRVRWELAPVPEGTKLRLIHERRKIEPELGGYIQGWSSFLVELREFSEALP